jgi:hypothetical protein
MLKAVRELLMKVVFSGLFVCCTVGVAFGLDLRLAVEFSAREVVSIIEYAKDAYTYNKERGSNFFSSSKATEKGYLGFVIRQDVEQDVRIIVAFHGTRGGSYQSCDIGVDATFGESGVSEYNKDLGLGEFCAHQGFSSTVCECYDQMCKQINRASGNSQGKKEVIFTGHSMGGAYAQLAALLYVKNNDIKPGQKLVKVFALSAPAIFDEVGCDLYHQMVGGFNSITICRSYDLICMPHKYGAHYYYPVGIVGDINIREGGYPQGLKAVGERLGSSTLALKIVWPGISVLYYGLKNVTKFLLSGSKWPLGEVRKDFLIMGACSWTFSLFAGSIAHFFEQEHAKDNFDKDVVEIVMKRIYDNCVANPSASLWSIGGLR